jgi:hypothetical protein
MAIKRIDSLLNPNDHGGLGDLVRHARGMGQLVEHLQQVLPDDEAASVVAANVRGDGTLVVLVSSSAWASRLRFETDTLMAAAAECDMTVKGCEVRVARGASDR